MSWFSGRSLSGHLLELGHELAELLGIHPLDPRHHLLHRLPFLVVEPGQTRVRRFI